MPASDPAVTAGWEELFSNVFYELLIGIVENDASLKKYGKFRDLARQKTKRQLETIGRYAGQYFVEHANPSPANLDHQDTDELKIAAVAYALDRFNEE